ncbi:MAG: dnaD, partial [Chitinophagaceae bacterium]|nr:dnaD [Chitinophagaceae bacterium]
MAERRMLSKTISTSRKVNKLTDRAGLLYTWLIAHTDDYGRMEGDALSVRAKVVPMRNSTIDEVESDLVILEKDLIKRYTVKDEIFLELLNFDSFQTFRSDRPRRAEYPDELGQLPTDNQRYTTDIPMGDIGQRKRREEKVREGKVREGKSAPPFAQISYLSNIPEDDLKEFTTRFAATEKQIKSKSEDLKLYCERKAKVYKNYKSFLLNALKNDFKERDTLPASSTKYQG